MLDTRKAIEQREKSKRVDRPAVDHERLRAVADEYGLDLVVLFGSHAKGRARVDSDVDIGVWSEHPKTLHDIQRYERERALRRALGRAIAHEQELQVVFQNRCDSLLMRQIVVSGKPLFTRTGATWAVFCSYANRRYYDDEKYRKRIAAFLDRQQPATTEE